MHEKINFCTRKFCVQSILNDINEQDTSFLDCKHKHMMKSGAPPDKFGVYLPIEFQGFTRKINSKGYYSLWSYLKFLEMVGVPLTLIRNMKFSLDAQYVTKKKIIFSCLIYFGRSWEKLYILALEHASVGFDMCSFKVHITDSVNTLKNQDILQINLGGIAECLKNKKEKVE